MYPVCNTQYVRAFPLSFTHHYAFPFRHTVKSKSHCTSSILYDGLCDDMVLWSIRGIPAWEIYGPASLLAILTTPTPFNLTAVIHCHCLMTMALANCQLTHRHYVFVCVCVCVCACLRAWMWDCWNTAPLCSTVAYSMSVKCRPEVTGRSAALVTIRNL